jgi:Leucine Rich repeat
MEPRTCRVLAKALVDRFESPAESSDDARQLSSPNTVTAPLSLYLSNNPGIGNAGTAALAAAIRRSLQSFHSHPNQTFPAMLLQTLDLSACNIGDIGANALALALEDATTGTGTVVAPIGRLILSHNQITDQGALSLGRAIQQMYAHHHQSILAGALPKIAIDLSDNPGITDRGLATLLDAVARGLVSELIVRSCSIHADGAELVGTALRQWSNRFVDSSPSDDCDEEETVTIDLSGNPLGLLRGKSKDTAGSANSGGYSASLIKSKATATASAYMTQGLSFLKRGLGASGLTTVESDDEEEKMEEDATDGGLGDGEKSDNLRCGFKALANAFIGRGDRAETISNTRSVAGGSPISRQKICLGLRRTFCDTAGADALAAMVQSLQDDDKVDSRANGVVTFDLSLELNPILEDEMIAALCGTNSDLLAEMAERHSDAMDVLVQAQERAAARAAQLVAAQRRQQQHQQRADRTRLDDEYDDIDDEEEQPVGGGEDLDGYELDEDQNMDWEDEDYDR